MTKSTRFENFKRSVWNPETKKCLGRTKESWFKLILFYIALYTCLAAIWSLYFYIFHLTISDKYPKWQLEESLIGTNPGLGVRPQSPRGSVDSALIRYKVGPDGNFEHWVNDLNEYLAPFNANKDQQAKQNNNYNYKESCDTNKDPSDTESYCPFDSSSIPPECTAAQNFSFPLGKPCILIKLNRIYGWKPEPYDAKPDKFPEGAPFAAGKIQITCEGQHDPDKEHIGPIEYYPNGGGLETKYYPFLNQPGYQSPFVMVHFKQMKLDTLIYVECKAWAKNVEHDRYNRKGMASFEFYLEKPKSSTETPAT